jgi:uncharacterized membrane protein
MRPAVERLAFFSDAVFAVALTLLVIHIAIPASYVTSDALHDSLGDVVPELIGFGISFAVIGVLWVEHHLFFDYVQRRDEGLLWMNLAFLLCVAFLPFPAGVFTKHTGAPVAVLFFAGSMFVTALVWSSVWWWATAGSKLVDGTMDRRARRHVLGRSLGTAAVFALSAPLVLVTFHVGEVDLTLASVGWLIGLIATRLWLRRS